MKEAWWIEHDNGTAGQRGCSDGYMMTVDEIRAEVERMQDAGIIVYSYGRM